MIVPGGDHTTFMGELPQVSSKIYVIPQQITAPDILKEVAPCICWWICSPVIVTVGSQQPAGPGRVWGGHSLAEDKLFSHYQYVSKWARFQMTGLLLTSLRFTKRNTDSFWNYWPINLTLLAVKVMEQQIVMYSFSPRTYIIASTAWI